MAEVVVLLGGSFCAILMGANVEVGYRLTCG